MIYTQTSFPPRLFHVYQCMACTGHAEHYFPQAEHLVVQLGLILAMGSSPCSPTCLSTSSSFTMSLCLVSTCLSCGHTSVFLTKNLGLGRPDCQHTVINEFLCVVTGCALGTDICHLNRCLNKSQHSSRSTRFPSKVPQV